MKFFSNSKGKPNIPLYALLVYLALIAVLASAITFSGYRSTATGSDSARVAKWSVEATGAETAAIALSEKDNKPSAAYSFTVTGDTETSWEYDIIVKQKDGARLPMGMSITLVRTDVSMPIPVAFTETTQLGGFAYRVEAAGIADPGSHAASYTIYFEADFDTLAESFSMDNIEISMAARQIQ